MPCRSSRVVKVILAGGMFIIASFSGAGCAGLDPGDSPRILSPDGRVGVEVCLRRGAPHYRIDYDGRPVILPSSMGFTFRKAAPLLDGFVIDSVETGSFDEIWRPVWGQRSQIRNCYNELSVGLKEAGAPGRRMSVVFRVYDDGVGFRYEIPRQQGLEDFEITTERTRFTFAADHSAYYIPADLDSYEHLYRNTPLSEIKAAGKIVEIPSE